LPLLQSKRSKQPNFFQTSQLKEKQSLKIAALAKTQIQWGTVMSAAAETISAVSVKLAISGLLYLSTSIIDSKSVCLRMRLLPNAARILQDIVVQEYRGNKLRIL
jgi:hypothetical protein